MNTHADKTKENKCQPVANTFSQNQRSSESTFEFVDNRPEVIAQRKLQEMLDNSPQAMQSEAFQDMGSSSPQVKLLATFQTMADSQFSQQTKPIQKKENNTGLPDNLKAGMEHLSGISLDDVKVHRNSDKPAQLQAHAYAIGTDIHLGPGQEKHLPHEVWHVVQQKQGRVKPTTQMKGKVNMNDDSSLEKEADVMGEKALQVSVSLKQSTALVSSPVQKVVQAKLSSGVLNVAGETHDEYTQRGNEGLRAKEKMFAEKKAGGIYWKEQEFKVTESDFWYGKNKGESGDPVRLQFLQCVELIDSLCGKFLPILNHTVKEEAKLLRERVEEGFRAIVGGVTARFKAMGDEHTSGVRTLSSSQANATKNIAPKLDQMREKCVAIYKLIQADGELNEGSDEITALKKDAIRLNSEIQKLAAIINDKKAVTQENVRVPRSKEMHWSAQASYATKGIWKVGNNHYDDIAEYIKGTFVKAPKYNLMSKVDFNKERDAFKEEE